MNRCVLMVYLVLFATGSLGADERDPTPLVAAIDKEWSRALEAAGIPASPRADDAEFLRRTCLDITGRIPTYERTVAFLASDDPAKRRQLIDDLLASREFGLHFGQRWRNLILPPDTSSKKQQADRFAPWLAEQFNANRPWSEIVADLLTAEVDMHKDPRASFYLANSEESTPKPNLLAASTGRLFLGVQIGCAECHNHPFAAWTQDDFWSLAAFFGRVRKQSKSDSSLTEDLLNETSSAPRGSIIIPDGAGKEAGKVVMARFLDGSHPTGSPAMPLRPMLSAWITSTDNPYFARAMANRLWAHFFSRGLVHPVDDFRDENRPSHPELLQMLAQEFTASGHDVKHLIRCICNSRAYQVTSRPLPENETDLTHFSRMAVKVMTPDALYDSLHVVLNAHPSDEPSRSGKPTEKRSQKMLEPRDSFVRYFGQGADIDRGDQFAYGVPQLLRLMNAPEFNMSAPFISEMLRTQTGAEPMIEKLYLVALSRRPTAQESSRMTRLVGEETASKEAYAGVLWVLLNSSEFVLNR